MLIFDYPSLPDGILKQEHFDALKQFWGYVQSHPCTENPASTRVAFVVPKDYGVGFRGSTDRIWGLWEADNQSAQDLEPNQLPNAPIRSQVGFSL